MPFLTNHPHRGDHCAYGQCQALSPITRSSRFAAGAGSMAQVTQHNSASCSGFFFFCVPLLKQTSSMYNSFRQSILFITYSSGKAVTHQIVEKYYCYHHSLPGSWKIIAFHQQHPFDLVCVTGSQSIIHVQQKQTLFIPCNKVTCMKLLQTSSRWS